MTSQLKAQQEVVNLQVSELNSVYESKRAQLQENDTYNQLSSLESKLKTAESAVYGMKDCKFSFRKITSRYCIKNGREQLSTLGRTCFKND